MLLNNPNRDNFGRTVCVPRVVLSMIGVWPSHNDSSTLSIVWVRTLRFLCQALLYFVLVPGTLKIFLMESDMLYRLKKIGPICCSLMGVLKYLILIYHNDCIKDCIRHIEEDWRRVNLAEDRRIMSDSSRISRGFAILCVAFVYASGLLFRAVVPLVLGVVVTSQNVTIRPMIFDGYYIVNSQKTPAYEIIFAIQSLTGIMHDAVTSGACSLAALLVLHACGQLKIFIARMKDLTRITKYPDRDINSKLVAIVRQHIRIRSFLIKVEHILQYICLVEVIGGTFIVCLIGYYMLSDYENSNAVHAMVSMLIYIVILIASIFNIFILCFIGEFLTDQSAKMYITSCTLDWYRLPYRTARCLILLIAMSNVPVKITAGKFMDLSFNSFSIIIRTSVAYLNILRTVMI